MEDHREQFVLIMAGYTDQMNALLNSNPGLISRFGEFIQFEDFSVDELYIILTKIVSSAQMRLCDGCEDIARTAFHAAKFSPHFGNGRFVRSFFEEIISHQNTRILLDGIIDDAEIEEILVVDVEAAAKARGLNV